MIHHNHDERPSLRDEEIKFYDPFETLFRASNTKNEFLQSFEEATRVPGTTFSG